MSAASRRKGRAGETAAKHLLQARDYVVDDLSGGITSADLLASDDSGTWLVEVKNCAGILPGHTAQAMRQAASRKLRWMLISKIAGSSSWLVQKQGERPVVWHEGEQE